MAHNKQAGRSWRWKGVGGWLSLSTSGRTSGWPWELPRGAHRLRKSSGSFFSWASGLFAWLWAHCLREQPLHRGVCPPFRRPWKLVDVPQEGPCTAWCSGKCESRHGRVGREWSHIRRYQLFLLRLEIVCCCSCSDLWHFIIDSSSKCCCFEHAYSSIRKGTF